MVDRFVRILALASLWLTTLAWPQNIVPSESGATFNLTHSEAEWLRKHPNITVLLDPSWPPVEFQDENNKQAGMSKDYLDLVEKRIGYRFKRIENQPWDDAYKRLKRWEIDMTTAVSPTEDRESFWLFTEPYLDIPIVIATQIDVTYVEGLKEISDKPIAVVKSYAIEEWLMKDYPNMNLVRVKTPAEGLEKLQRGEVFAYVDNLLVIGYYQAKMRAVSIKISGRTPYSNKVSMAVRRDWPELASILNRALKSISKAEREAIYRRWLPVRYEHGFDYTLLWKVVAGFVVLVTVLVAWNRMLAKEVRQRKRAEASLIESEGNYRSLLSGNPNPVLRFDIDTKLLFASDSLESVTGLRLEDAIGRSIRELSLPEQAKLSLETSVREVLQNGVPLESEIDWSGNGETIHALRVIPEFSESGELRSVLAVSHDVSERKRYERRIVALNEELEREVERRTTQLKNALEELDSFSYSVSHDLRAPLRAIDGFSVELLEDYSSHLPEDAIMALMRVRKAAKRMSSLIDGLLSLSRLARAELSSETIDLSEMFRTAFESDETATDPHTEIDIQPGMTVEADPVLMSAVVGNLMGNAIKYTRKQASPRIECGCFGRDGTKVYYVRDNGVGFDMAHSDKLFTAFQRLHAERDFPGTGIGLATVRRILRRMGGSIWAESEVGKGATFYFTIGAPDG